MLLGLSHLRFAQLRDVRFKIELDALGWPGQQDASDEEHKKKKIREEGRHVDHLACPLDPSPDAEVADHPSKQEGQCEWPA